MEGPISVPRVAPTTGGLTTTYEGSDRMSKRICSVPECGNDAKARGWCFRHYQRWQKHGDPEFTLIIKGDDHARFWVYAGEETSTGCREWTGACDKDGYGVTWQDGKSWRAPRLAWKLTHGSISNKLIVRHKCDNPPCINPEHLELGTYRENTGDAQARHRLAYGTRNKSAKLTPEVVRKVRKALDSGGTQRGIARDLGVSRTAVRGVATGRTWGWLK